MKDNQENNNHEEVDGWDFSDEESIDNESKEVVSHNKLDSEETINENLEIPETNKELEDLRGQLNSLKERQQKTHDWGQEHRFSYVLTKERIEKLSDQLTEKLSNKLSTDGMLFEDDLKELLEEVQEIKKAYDHTFSAKDLEEEKEKEVSPFQNTVNNLKSGLEEYKKWNKDENADLKFATFFFHLKSMTPNKAKDVQDYLLGESPKEALQFILDKGNTYYNKLYKHTAEKGDAFLYVEELSAKNEKLEKELKILREKLDETEGIVDNRTIKSRGSNLSKDVKQNDNWGSGW